MQRLGFVGEQVRQEELQGVHIPSFKSADMPSGHEDTQERVVKSNFLSDGQEVQLLTEPEQVRQPPELQESQVPFYLFVI